MNTAHRTFVATSWLFLIMSALLFLVPTPFASAQGAAWTCLGVGIASHIALLAAIIWDQIPGQPNNPVSEG